MASDNISYNQEALRKSTHFLALLIPAGYLLFPRLWSIVVLAVANVVIISFEIIRLRRLRPWSFLSKFFGGMIRPKEQDRNFTGALYILFTALAVIILFDKYIAAVAMSFIIVGDVASAMVGRRYGRHFIRGKKTVEGSLAFLVTALLIVVLLPKLPYTVGIIGAVVATVVEAISIHRDDNLTVPLTSGLVMHLLITIFPGLP